MAGKLYLVATPIGNLEDITLRAIRILGEVDLIAAEDTRTSGRLLKHLNIRKPLISYYEHNKKLREDFLLRELTDGKDIALICDAGTPGLSDPGADIVAAAITAGIEVISIPGASALLTAFTASGLNQGGFCFEGFLPRVKSARRKALQSLSREKRVMVFYEAPHRIIFTLKDMADSFGASRHIAVCRELTKMFEEFKRGSLAEMIEYFSATPPRGEFTLIVAGAKTETTVVDWTIVETELNNLLKKGLPRKAASKEIAARFQLKSKEIYAIGLKEDTNYASRKNN